MKPRLSKSEENRAAAASLLADLDEEFSTIPAEALASIPLNKVGTETRNKPVTNPEWPSLVVVEI